LIKSLFLIFDFQGLETIIFEQIKNTYFYLGFYKKMEVFCTLLYYWFKLSPLSLILIRRKYLFETLTIQLFLTAPPSNPLSILEEARYWEYCYCIYLPTQRRFIWRYFRLISTHLYPEFSNSSLLAITRLPCLELTKSFSHSSIFVKRFPPLPHHKHQLTYACLHRQM